MTVFWRPVARLPASGNAGTAVSLGRRRMLAVMPRCGRRARLGRAAPEAPARIQLATLETGFQWAMAEPQWTRQRAMAWQPAVAALERLLEAVTATVVTTAGQPS